MRFCDTKRGRELAIMTMCGFAGTVFGAASALAQASPNTQTGPAATSLPSVSVEAPKPQQSRAKRAQPTRAVVRSRSSLASRGPSGTQEPGPGLVGRSATGKANGPVQGYLASQSATATKTDTPILTTPQSISVVTKDQVEDQGAANITEALRYTPGVTVESFGANAFFDAFKLRGFDTPRYLDGLRLPADSTTFAVPRIETYGLERIEVLKGPSSGLYGQSDPGGLLNMVSRRPTDTPHYEVVGTVGSFDRLQGAFDIGGPVDKNGRFLYRIVGLGGDSNSQTDFVQDNKLFIAPSFTWRPDLDTSFTLLTQYQRVDNEGYQRYVPGQVSFLPNPNGHIPYGRYLGVPGLTAIISSNLPSATPSSTASTTTCNSDRTRATPRSATTSPPPAPRAWSPIAWSRGPTTM
jgi:iron complex outermembrane receptor protein